VGTNRLGELIQALGRRSGDFLSPIFLKEDIDAGRIDDWCERLLSEAGEASGMAVAGIILDYWRGLDEIGRGAFLDMLASRFGVDAGKLGEAIHAYHAAPGDLTAANLHRAAEPRRQDLFRRLNLVPGGVGTLVRMREDLLDRQAADVGDYTTIDIDFLHLFSSWFNRGFLVLQRIDWNTSASILEKIIRYEAVHAIQSWDDLRRRLQPDDRRCYAFFHPQLPDEPLIFVEVALTDDMPEAIAPLLAEDRRDVTADRMTHAVFYSISNCQKGMRGVSFGNFLIKQVVEELRHEIPELRHFVTLSPVPGFTAWLRRDTVSLPEDAGEVLQLISQDDWADSSAVRKRLTEILPSLAASYFLSARNRDGRLVDPVARFHLGNGASLARINCFGDVAPKALANQLGLMVNYRYELRELERNHERFVSAGVVAAEPAVRGLLPRRRPGLAGTWRKLSEATF
jgi:malonyl-CoA decarboxylase